MAKVAALLTVTIGWIVAVAIGLFLRTLENPAAFWLWVIVVIAFLPRETYKVYRLYRDGDSGFH